MRQLENTDGVEMVLVPLGDAVELTRGGEAGSSEDKRYVYS